MAAKKIKKNPGHVSFNDNKLRIEFKDSTESILFEDISSMSNSKVEIANGKYILLGLLLFFVFAIVAVSIESDAGAYILLIGILGMIALIVLAYRKKIGWDDVVVETRGGKEVKFSVERGKGIETVDSIENEKRKHT